jgi:outer membrane protein
MKNILIGFLVLFSSVVWAQSDQKQEFTLAEAQQFAVENHLRVKNAQLEYEESKKKVQETTAIGLPQVSAAANFQHFFEIPVTVVDAVAFDPNAPPDATVPIAFGQNNNADASLTASQLIFDGTFIVGLQAAKTYKELREHGLGKTEIEVKNMVSRAYYNTLIAEENDSIFTENVKKLEEQYEELSKLYEAGFIEEIEVDQLDLILSDAVQRKKSISRQIEVSYQLLNFQMGRPIDAPLKLTEDLQTIYRNYDESQLLNSELSIENHIDFKMIETQERISLLQIRADKASRLPSIGGVYNLAQNSYEDLRGTNAWFRSSFVGINIKMPIFTSTMNHSKLQQSKIQLDRVQNEKRILEDNLKIEVSVARTTYIDALEQFRTEQKNLDISKKIFDITRTKQKNGLASSLDVTVANNQFLKSQGNYITALYRILDAKATLDKALNNY